MSPAAVAFVPTAPLLVPQIAGGSAALDAELRVACLDVVSRAVDSDPASVVVVASTPACGTWAGDATWDFAGFGVDGERPEGRPALPWPLGIGAWLLDECGWAGSRQYVGIGPDAELPDVAVSERSVVVAVADGSGCRTERAPGHLDARAEPFDDGIADCLARGDPAALAATDSSLGQQLLCSGLPAWRWVARAVDDAPIARAELLTHVAPYGVAYFVALWWF